MPPRAPRYGPPTEPGQIFHKKQPYDNENALCRDLSSDIIVPSASTELGSACE